MTTVTELEKIDAPALTRKKIRAEEIYKMMEIGILPEESGWELIDGEIIHRMTIGSRHASVVRKLEKILERNFGDIVIISGQNPIHIDEYNEPEPNIALLKLRADFYAADHPLPEDVLLLIEVSDTTLEYDREIKKILYAAAGIQEFWIINLKENTIECYSSPNKGKYYLVKIVAAGEIAESVSIENLTLNLEEILAF